MTTDDVPTSGPAEPTTAATAPHDGPAIPAPAPATDPVDDPSDGRRRHYGAFYGLDELPAGDAPFVVVSGNCQAEALRILLGDTTVRTVRLPPVFELTAAEVPLLTALLERADVFVTQPVRDGYRDLALGSDELATHLRPGARVIRYPSFYWAGLYPWQAVVHAPGAGDPPGIPYVDLRCVVEVATGRRPSTPMARDGIVEMARASVETLRRREIEAGLVPVSDLLMPARGDECLVVNHPGNRMLVALARRLQEAMGLEPTATDPGRVLLSEVVAPLYPEVVEALALDVEPRPHFTFRGRTVTDDEVRDEQVPWLREHPQVVERALGLHRDTVRSLGW